MCGAAACVAARWTSEGLGMRAHKQGSREAGFPCYFSARHRMTSLTFALGATVHHLAGGRVCPGKRMEPYAGILWPGRTRLIRGAPRLPQFT